MGGNGLVIRSTDGGQNFSSSNPTSRTLNGVHFVSDTRGWAVGTNGAVLSTIDGGDAWTQTSPTTYDLNAVFFIDDTHGWAVGNGGKILRTANGGTSWITSTPTSSSLYSVFFVNASLGWAVGNGVVLRTTNGGINWTSASPTTAALRGVHFVDTSLGFAVGSNGTVLKSVNGGLSWASSKPTTSSLNAVHFVSATSGFAVGQVGSIIQTTDGGANWDEQRPVTTELNAVSFVNDHTGWAVGASGVVLRTNDAGANWALSHATNATLNDVFIASAPAGVNVTVATSPAGRSITVDGVDYTAPQTFVWDSGSPHTIATISPQSAGAGTRYVFSSWNNGGAISQAVSPTADVTYTATFTTQHLLTMNAGANGTVTPPTGWYNANTSVAIAATPDPGYGFNGWAGSGTGSYSGWANPVNITLNGPLTENAAFGTTVTVVVQASPSGREIVVDGTPYTTSQTFTWTPGSPHTIDATTPQDAGANTRYLFTRWSDQGTAGHTVTPVSNTTYTATFRVQYMLTMQSGAGGSVTPASDWRDGGSSVTITATPDAGYWFQSWTGSGSGSYSGSSNPKTITVRGPVTETATFAAGSGPAPPATLSLLPNAPNPFATTTDIRFGLPEDSDVHIDVFDVMGRRVVGDVVRGAPRGWSSYRLDASTPGTRLASGVYLVRVSTPRESRTGRMVVLR